MNRRSSFTRALDRLMTIKVGRVPIAALLAVAIVLGAPIAALARPGYLTTWAGKYPNSTSDNNAGCNLCHGTSTNNWNAYGSAIRQVWASNGNNISAAIDAVEGLDSDSDPTGSSNLAEINANTQPGWTTGNNNTIYDTNGDPIATNQPPPSGIGALDPSVGQPDIDVSPTLNFGTVAVGSSSTQSVTVANVGSADLTVSSLGVSGSADFALGAGAPSTPFTVAAGGNESVPVRYTPSGTGSDAGTLTIGSNDPDESSVEVSLSGTGATATGVTDLDIAAFRARHRVSLSRWSLALKLVIKNNGTQEATGTALIRGFQDGQAVYQTTISPVTDPLGNGRTRYVHEVPSDGFVAGLRVRWEVELDVPDDVDGPGNDTAGAFTRVVP